jgi:hypothetical protein
VLLLGLLVESGPPISDAREAEDMLTVLQKPKLLPLFPDPLDTDSALMITNNFALLVPLEVEFFLLVGGYKVRIVAERA